MRADIKIPNALPGENDDDDDAAGHQDLDSRDTQILERRNYAVFFACGFLIICTTLINFWAENYLFTDEGSQEVTQGNVKRRHEFEILDFFCNSYKKVAVSGWANFFSSDPADAYSGTEASRNLTVFDPSNYWKLLHELSNTRLQDFYKDARHHVRGLGPSSTVPITILKKLYLAKGNQLTPSYMAHEIFPHIQRPLPQLSFVVTGGAGFIGSHLVDRLMLLGHRVLVIDNYSTGQASNIMHWSVHPNFLMYEIDIQDSKALQTLSVDLAKRAISINFVVHLACPASPPKYQESPVDTLKTAFIGTLNMLTFTVSLSESNSKASSTANSGGSPVFILASTSEVYGDPVVHPQAESYSGNVPTIGPRSSYEEGKRSSEALACAFAIQHNLDVRVARIFNTFGPRMSTDDGRIMTSFIGQLLAFKAKACKQEDGALRLKIFGSGQQTRTLLPIHDLIDGLLSLLQADRQALRTATFQCNDTVDRLVLKDSTTTTTTTMNNEVFLVNLGGEIELSVLQIASLVRRMFSKFFCDEPRPTISSSMESTEQFEHELERVHEPRRRRPCLQRAKLLLSWRPKFHFLTMIYEMILFMSIMSSDKF